MRVFAARKRGVAGETPALPSPPQALERPRAPNVNAP